MIVILFNYLFISCINISLKEKVILFTAEILS